MANLSKTTNDHEEIQKWAEERGGKPSHVKSTGSTDDIGVLRIDFPGYSGQGSLEEISWDQFFEKFDERGLSLIYQEETAGGERSNFNKIVSAETAEENESSSSGSKRSSSKKSSSKKSSAKKSAKKSGPIKKTSARKVATKKTVSKKAVGKKAPVKKSAAKKTPAKKTSSKKTAAKKTTAKKGATKKRR